MSNDDGAESGCDVNSSITYTLSGNTCQTLTLRQGCLSSGTCSGTFAIAHQSGSRNSHVLNTINNTD